MTNPEDACIFMAYAPGRRTAEQGRAPGRSPGEVIDQEGHLLSSESQGGLVQYDPASTKALIDAAWQVIAMLHEIKAQTEQQNAFIDTPETNAEAGPAFTFPFGAAVQSGPDIVSLSAQTREGALIVLRVRSFENRS